MKLGIWWQQIVLHWCMTELKLQGQQSSCPLLQGFFQSCPLQSCCINGLQVVFSSDHWIRQRKKSQNMVPWNSSQRLWLHPVFQDNNCIQFPQLLPGVPGQCTTFPGSESQSFGWCQQCRFPWNVFHPFPQMKLFPLAVSLDWHSPAGCFKNKFRYRNERSLVNLLTYMGVFGLSFVRFLRGGDASPTWIWHTGS